jgi:hypothetical protein
MAIAGGVTVVAGVITFLWLQRARTHPAIEAPVMLESAREGAAAP